MICKNILKEAEKQLLSLGTSLKIRFIYKQQTPSMARCKFHSLPVKPSVSMQCLSSVPQPPPSVGFSVGKFEKQDQTAEEENSCHVPVMVKEVMSYLEPKNNQVMIDMTFGAGGHARHILRSCPDAHYIAVDRDPVAFDLAKNFAAKYRKGQVVPLLSKFSELPSQLKKVGVDPGTVDCILMDLGVSSMQFDTASRGFSLSKDGPLDMRMDRSSNRDSLTAADVVNMLDSFDLAHILKKYGEEKKAKAIAHAIVEARYAFGPFTHTKQLADVIKSVFDSSFRHDKLHRHSHVATKTFQALRIFVNDELNEVNNGLNVAHHYLKHNGCCAVISFHSLEDRIVKCHFHGLDLDPKLNLSIQDHLRDRSVTYNNEEIRNKFLSSQWLPLRRKILEPSDMEVQRNPRARSAKLRAALKMKRELD